jgi:hypothetical protein
MWLFSAPVGDEGVCVWRDNTQISCSDLGRWSQCITFDFGDETECIWSETSPSPCVEIRESCNSVTNYYDCITTGVVVDENCFWIYDNNDPDMMTGSCRSVDDNSLACFDITREDQCNNGLVDTFLEDKCFFDVDSCVFYCDTAKNKEDCDGFYGCCWIYSSAIVGSDDGICYSENAELSCEEIKRTSQCESGGEIFVLDGKCWIYDGLCKTKCNEVAVGICNSETRLDDCFLLEASGEKTSSCIDLV